MRGLRSPRLVLSLLILGALTLSACGGSDADQGAGTTASPPAIALIPQPATAAPGEAVQFRVTNNSREPVSFGLGGGLQRLVDGAWTRVRGFRHTFQDILLSVDPGETTGPDYSNGKVFDDIELPDDLEPGHYRWRRIFRGKDDSRLVGAAAFNVAPTP